MLVKINTQVRQLTRQNKTSFKMNSYRCYMVQVDELKDAVDAVTNAIKNESGRVISSKPQAFHNLPFLIKGKLYTEPNLAGIFKALEERGDWNTPTKGEIVDAFNQLLKEINLCLSLNQFTPNLKLLLERDNKLVNRVILADERKSEQRVLSKNNETKEEL